MEKIRGVTQWTRKSQYDSQNGATFVLSDDDSHMYKSNKNDVYFEKYWFHDRWVTEGRVYQESFKLELFYD